MVHSDHSPKHHKISTQHIKQNKYSTKLPEINIKPNYHNFKVKRESERERESEIPEMRSRRGGSRLVPQWPWIGGRGPWRREGADLLQQEGREPIVGHGRWIGGRGDRREPKPICFNME